jgi:hypothetical protein
VVNDEKIGYFFLFQSLNRSIRTFISRPMVRAKVKAVRIILVVNINLDVMKMG